MIFVVRLSEVDEFSEVGPFTFYSVHHYFEQYVLWFEIVVHYAVVSQEPE